MSKRGLPAVFLVLLLLAGSGSGEEIGRVITVGRQLPAAAAAALP